jgi:hypothetical protein
VREPSCAVGIRSRSSLLPFPDIAHWDLLAFVVGDRDREDALAQKDAFGTISKSGLPEVWQEVRLLCVRLRDGQGEGLAGSAASAA